MKLEELRVDVEERKRERERGGCLNGEGSEPDDAKRAITNQDSEAGSEQRLGKPQPPPSPHVEVAGTIGNKLFEHE